MTRKIILKIVLIIFMIILFSSITLNSVNAAKSGFQEAGLTKAGTVFDGNNVQTNFSNVANKSANTIVSILRTVGMAIAVAMLLILAMKYMLSSAGDRADIKKHAIVYVVGALVLFGAVGILGVINSFTTQVLES